MTRSRELQRRQTEERARRSIDARYEQPLTDEEWSVAARNLRDLVMLLASWDRKRHVVVGANDEAANDEQHN